jgi:iron complex transport system substrate-binding protein
MLCALGLADRLQAISHECDFPKEIVGKPRATFSNVDSHRSSQAIDDQVKELVIAGRPLYEIDRALVRDLRPDLIVTQSQCDVCAVKYTDVLDFVRDTSELQDTNVLALNPSCLEDVFVDLLRIGQATGKQKEAEQLVASYRWRVEKVQSRVQSLTAEQRPRVVCIEWIEPLMIAANWTPQLLEWAGGKPGLAVAGQHSGYVSWDSLQAFDPEVIVISPCGFDLRRTQQESQRLIEQPSWSSLSAVRNDRVFTLDGNAYLNRSGPRLVETLEILAHLLHPSLFDAAELPLNTADTFAKYHSRLG